MYKFTALLILTSLTCTVPAAGPAEKDAGVVVPREVISLFNGRDLSAFYTWLVDDHREDPRQIFSVVECLDGAPAIRISGQIYGGLYTRQQYANYRLVAEFRWGLVTWGSRTNATKDSGVLVHCTGPDGNYYSPTFNGPWMRGYEFQIIQGGVGDVLVLGGYDPDGSVVKCSATLTTRLDRDGEAVWDPKGEPKVFQSGRINWWGRDVDWEDKLGFRGREDVESPDGQWTRIEVVCRDDTLDYYVNGQRVNRATHLSHRAGQLIFQSEGAEIYFRKIELHPLPAAN
ncbi:MAG TPA: DUF1080 domain-containing protein [Verrucomicrobiota bacterium]|nr:DUF1080 domain-containing protein [Verrucomicrobiota bacterium]HNT15207.1 DUF1080 domain-containing protein [Verrucomicrobiota bacterium]